MTSAVASTRSIRRRLLVWLLGGMLLAIAAAAIGTYMRAREDANALFDYQLQEMAASLTGAPFAGVRRPRPTSRRARHAGRADLGQERRRALHVAAAPACCRNTRSSASTPSPPTAASGACSARWPADRCVQVVQPMSARRELAASLALQSAAAGGDAVSRRADLVQPSQRLAPLDRVAADVARRSRRSSSRCRRPTRRANAAAGARAQRAAAPVRRAGGAARFIADRARVAHAP